MSVSRHGDECPEQEGLSQVPNDEISQYEQTHGELSQHVQMCEEDDVIVSQCAE